MAKQKWKPGNMVYPLPAVLVSCGDKEGNLNLMTAAWTGTICSDPQLTPVHGALKYAPMVEESPVSIECQVTQVVELGSHDMFMAKVTAVYVDETYMDGKGTFHLEKAEPLVYSHGQYYGIGKHIGGFGYAVRKKTVKKKPGKKK